MSVKLLSSFDPGYRAEVCCVGTSHTGVLNKPEGSVVLVLFIQWKERFTLYCSLPRFSLFLVSFSRSLFLYLSHLHTSFLPHFIFIIKQVSWILHSKWCCFKQSVMSAFLWRKSNKLSSENKCFESLDLTCMCFFLFATHFYFFVCNCSLGILVQKMWLASWIKLLTMLLTLEW